METDRMQLIIILFLRMKLSIMTMPRLIEIKDLVKYNLRFEYLQFNDKVGCQNIWVSEDKSNCRWILVSANTKIQN